MRIRLHPQFPVEEIATQCNDVAKHDIDRAEPIIAWVDTSSEDKTFS